jgi:hypothetical protein
MAVRSSHVPRAGVGARNHPKAGEHSFCGRPIGQGVARAALGGLGGVRSKAPSVPHDYDPGPRPRAPRVPLRPDPSGLVFGGDEFGTARRS